MSKRDYYEVLGISKTSSEGDVKKAYRILALQYHPDRNSDDPSAEEKFKEASEAYEVLSNAEKKSLYDRFGHAGLSGAGHQGFHDINDIFSNFGSIFDEFFGFGGGFGGGGRRGRAGRDMRYDLTVTLEEALMGASKTIEFDKPASCDSCQGKGAMSSSDIKPCSTCGGAGQVRRSQGFFSVQTPCPTCAGEGTVIANPCKSCRGKGIVIKKKTLNVKVPAGVDSGMQLRLSSEGEAGSNGGPAGDLYVVMEVEPSDLWYREGVNLIINQSIGMAQAALGCKIEIQAPEGQEVIEVPAGVQHGHRISVASKGFPSLRGRGRGDLIFEMHVEIPKRLNKEQRELLKKFAELQGESVQSGQSGFFSRLFSLD